MSFEDGWAAIHLDMPTRVPRTEYSAEGHWALLSAVTGIAVDANSPDEVKQQARNAFIRAWNYDFFWSILVGRTVFGEQITRMGHGVYAAGGTDYDDRIGCLFRTPEEALAFDPAEAYGLPDHAEQVRAFEAHYRNNCRANPTGVNMTGIYVTCISGLIDILGWDMLLLAAGTDPRAFGDLTNRYAAWIQHYFNALGEADVPLVMVHDDIVWTSGAFMHPDWYRTYVFPHFRKCFAPLAESGKRILFTSDGDYTEFVDDLAAAGVHGFVLEPMTDLATIVERYGQTHVIVGNADTRILLGGTRAAIRAEVERCMTLGRACPGFFMAVGNHIPPNTPVDAALYYNDVYEELSRR